MASSVSSSLNTYAGIERYSPNFQLLGQVLNAKQTQLNTNRNKLQDFRNQLGALDVVKDEDRAYLDQRLDQVTDISNKYANLDLSSDALTNSLLGNMGQVFDENVKAALTGTKILRNEQAEWSKMKEKDITKYSDANYAYAMQNANRWMTDGKTGTRYNGGGGFIEYASPEDEMNKNMPDALKAATHKRQRPIAGPAGGIGGIITEEYVDREELQNILLSKLDAKNLRQFDIDAWAKYDQKPPELLKADYENYTQPQIDEANSKIESLQAAIANTSNKDAKQTYQNSLDSYLKQKSSLENEYSYDNFVSTYGKSAVYSSLHKNQVMDKFLDAYSRDPEVVDIKVNDIDKANREMEFERMKISETRRHNLASELNEQLKAAATLKAAKELKEGKVGKEGFITGKKLEVTPEQKSPSVFTDLDNESKSLHSGIEATLINDMHVSPKLAKDFMKSKRFADMVKNGNMAGLNEIVLGEKQYKYKVSSAFRKSITELSTGHYNNPMYTQAYGEIDNMVSKAQRSIGTGLVKGAFSESNVPNFTIGLQKNKAGKYEVGIAEKGYVFGSSGKDPEYKRLLKKQANLKSGQSLTTLEKENLKLYGNLHLLNDGGLSEERRSFVKKRIINQLNDLDLDNKSYTKISLESKIGLGETMPNTTAKVRLGKDSWMSEITKSDVRTYGEDVSNYFEYQQIAPVKQLLAEERQNPGKYSKKEVDIWKASLAKYEKSFNKKGVDVADLLDQNFKAIEDNLSRSIVKETRLIAGNSKVLPKKGNEDRWKRLAGNVGVATTDDSDLIITPVIKNGKPTGEVTITTKSSGKKPEELEPVRLPAGDLEAIGVAKFDLKNHKYNAERANAAPVLNLGNGNYKGRMDAGMNSVQKSLLLNVANDYPEIGGDIKRLLQEYSEGKYIAKIVPISGSYYTRIINSSTGEDVLEGYENNVGSLIEDDQVDQYLENPKPIVDNAIYDMIMEYANSQVAN